MKKRNLEESIGFMTLKLIVVDVIGDILYWPLWWYSKGLVAYMRKIVNELLEFEHRLGLKIWLSSMTKPMFGQYDWQGRLISLFMRVVVLIGKLIYFVIWVVFQFILLVAWVVLPLYALYQIFIQGSAVIYF